MEANAILTFRDGEGKEWLAAAQVGPLIRKGEAGKPDKTLTVEELKDRGYVMSRFTVIHK
jgi:hypothetical protein